MEQGLKRTGASIAGASAGAAIAGPGGAIIGSSIGGVIGQALFPDETETLPGASGQEKQMMGIQTQAAEKALGMQGLSATEVSSIGQIGRETQQQQADRIASLPMQLSSLDRQRMGKMLAAQSRETRLSVEDKIARLDPKAQMRNISTASDIANRGASQAQQMRAAEQARVRFESQQRKEQAEAFNQSVASLVRAIGVGYDIGSETDWSWGDDSIPTGVPVEDGEGYDGLTAREQLDFESNKGTQAVLDDEITMDEYLGKDIKNSPRQRVGSFVDGDITANEYLNDSFSAVDYL